MKGIQRPMPSSFQQALRRGDSGELDVFEATRYFSGELGTPKGIWSKSKMDMPVESELCKSYVKEEEKCKQQPSSPGGRLACFLNLLFQQSSLKKKLLKSLKSDREEERLMKKNTNRGTNSKAFHASSSSSSGFETKNTPHSRYYDKRNYIKRCWEERIATDGADSDTNSDLFELKNYELGNISSDLRVFGCTDVRVIKRRAPRFARAEIPARR